MKRIKILASAGHQKKWNNFANTDEATQNRRRMQIFIRRFLERFPDCEIIEAVSNDYDNITMHDKAIMSSGCDLQISFHSNSVNGRERGAFMIPDVDPDYAFVDLNKRVLEAYCKATGFQNKGLFFKTADGSVHNGPVPGGYNYYTEQVLNRVGIMIMMEQGHHDNPEDVKMLLDEDILIKGCDAIIDVIADYFGLEENENLEQNSNSNPIEIPRIPMKLILPESSKVYPSVDDLKKDSTSKIYSAEDYFIYKMFGEYANITKDLSFAGAWIKIRGAR